MAAFIGVDVVPFKKFQLLIGLVLLSSFAHNSLASATAVPSSALSLLLPPSPAEDKNRPRTSLASGLKSLCNEHLKRPHSLDWNRMLGAWYLETASQTTPSTAQCIVQTFNYVDMHFGVLDKTMYMVPGPTEDEEHPVPIEFRTFGVFDPINDPNTVVSLFDIGEGEKIPIETIILETDYSSYAIGYECSAGIPGAGEEVVPATGFEHMAILTRSSAPLSAANRSRLIRRAMHSIPSSAHNSHKFYQVSKSGCGDESSRTAEGRAYKSDAQNQQHHQLVVKPDEAAAYMVDPSSQDSVFTNIESRSSPSLVDGFL